MTIEEFDNEAIQNGSSSIKIGSKFLRVQFIKGHRNETRGLHYSYGNIPITKEEAETWLLNQ